MHDKHQRILKEARGGKKKEKHYVQRKENKNYAGILFSNEENKKIVE